MFFGRHEYRNILLIFIYPDSSLQLSGNSGCNINGRKMGVRLDKGVFFAKKADTIPY